jgi:molecular chaperone DnaJ
VKVPPGVEDGSQLRLRREGEASQSGGSPGDLYVQIHVAPHRYFRREDADLYYDLSIGFPQVTLGTEVTVPTLEGDVTMTIQPGTQPGQILRLKGKGMPRLNSYGRGNLMVRVNVVVPTRLSSKQKELLEALAKESGQEVKSDRHGFFKF